MFVERINEYKNYIYRCIHCKACRFSYSGEPDRTGYGSYTGILTNCTAGNTYGWESHYGSGKVWIARALIEGTLQPSAEMADILLRCPTCGNCQTQCENNIPITEIIEALRATCVDAGILAQEKHRTFLGSIKANNNPYQEKHEKRTSWLQYPREQRQGLVYFVGCTAAYRQNEVALATTRLLEKLGLSHSVLSDEVCCGSPALRIGHISTVKQLMKENLRVLRNVEAKQVLFSCAGCYRTFKVDYPKYAGNLPFNVVHAVEFFSDLLDRKALMPSKRVDQRVTWHDPCHLGRHITSHFKGRASIETSEIRQFRQDWYEKPRRLLTSIPGVELVEMYRNREDAWCCGAGGGVRSAFPDLASRTAQERIREAEGTGAESLVTACPFCLTNLSDAARELSSRMAVLDLFQLLERSI